MRVFHDAPDRERADGAPHFNDLLPCLQEALQIEIERPKKWPEKLYVLHYSVADTDRQFHGIAQWGDVLGLATFRSRERCLAFASQVINPPSRAFKASRISFEEAVRIAQAKGDEIQAVLLIGDPGLLYCIR